MDTARKKRIEVPCTAEELATAKRLASGAHRTVADYVRLLIGRSDVSAGPSFTDAIEAVIAEIYPDGLPIISRNVAAAEIRNVARTAFWVGFRRAQEAPHG